MRINSQGFIELTEDNEIFVFGSNEDGNHDAGAAKFALDNYGAVYGKGFGLQGRSYAIDTMSGFDVLEREADLFIYFAETYHDYQFITTPIGCGVAGYTPEQIAPLFCDAPPNVILPKEFVECLKSS